MKTFIPLSIALFLCFSVRSQSIEVIDFKTLQQKFLDSSDTTYVVNFFASWCKPCIDELPDLLNFADSQKDYKVKLILVSLDFKDTYKISLQPLIKKFIISHKIYLLTEPVSDQWVSEIDSNWSGAIPATLILNNKKKLRKFVATSVTYQYLFKMIK